MAKDSVWHNSGHPEEGVKVVCYWFDGQPYICYYEDGYWYFEDDNAYERVEIEEPDYWIECPDN